MLFKFPYIPRDIKDIDLRFLCDMLENIIKNFGEDCLRPRPIQNDEDERINNLHDIYYVDTILEIYGLDTFNINIYHNYGEIYENFINILEYIEKYEEQNYNKKYLDELNNEYSKTIYYSMLEKINFCSDCLKDIETYENYEDIV